MLTIVPVELDEELATASSAASSTIVPDVGTETQSVDNDNSEFV